jgi:hypothetical protein
MGVSADFDFTTAMRRLCVDITQRVDEFAHVNMDHVCVAFAQARRRVSHGLQAKLTPLRFEDGRLTEMRRGVEWTVQRVFHGEREMLYILTFYLPRFLDHCLREKLITVMHELYHISPRFDGDIRRLPGHYHVHSHSQAEYDRQMGVLVDGYLAQRPPVELYGFLERDFRTLATTYRRVVGVKVPIPKLVPVKRTA